MPGTVASPHWFSETFGFAEEAFDRTRDKFHFADGVLESKVNGRSFHVGSFELVSVSELRARLGGLDGTLGALSFSNVCGNAQTLHRDVGNQGAVFQVASQFNCLEMNEPGARPEDGVTRYYSDATQGPACAISCPAGTVYRNYFVNGSGQAKGRQLDGLADIAELVGNAKEKYWRMVNGYCLPTDNKSMGRLAQRLKEDEKLSEAVRDRLRIGVHWDTEVANKDHRVCQVFCSALPVAYAKSTRSQDWEAFGRLVLQGTFEATLAIAALLSMERNCRTKVYLSAVGGGAFGNRTAWIVDAIERALRIHAESPLDVMLVHFSSVPRGAYGDLEKGRKKLKATVAKPATEATEATPSPAEVSEPSEAAPAASDAVILAKAFKRLDLNGDGVILEEEMQAVLKKIMPDLTVSEVKTIFCAADANSDGELHYVEFASWVTREEAGAVAKEVLQLGRAPSEAEPEKVSEGT